MNKEAELKGMIGDGDKDGYDVAVVGSGYGDSVAACRMSNAGIKILKKMNKEARVGDGDEDGYDAVVVGSGYGGSVAACRMSNAGIKVCLIEKGRRWEAQDFPTDSFKMMSNVRMEHQNLGVRFGPKDALFQLYDQNDSLAAVACGLGGGSLVNAGVIVPTPVRARRNPKWPNEWERDWDNCEASALAMLRPQSVPVKFPVAKVFGEIADGQIEQSFETSVKLSINFDLEEPTANSQTMGSCLACGNCLAGCPYNAKGSTDKNYLHSAIQAGCDVRTECQVQYVVKNPYDTCQEEDINNRKRRWRVYLDEIDYITCDFVVLSAGVLGTAEILFRSQMRGLKLSDALGSGFSCNGNNVAYLAGSPAPLKSFGLDKKQLSNIPFQERPGPAISSSYTSSLGFTIQSAVLPTAYPYLVFKGIACYGWPIGYWFFHGIIDKIRHIIGFKANQAIALNAMGYDDSDGKIMLDKDMNRICFSPPHDPLLPKKIKTFQKLAKKLGGILYLSRYRSTSVHLLGGCNASSNPSYGVCNPNGQVFDPESSVMVHPGLYICDASLIPCSVGINPSLTISTAAEYVSRHLVQDVLKYKSVKTASKSPHSISNMNIKSGMRSMVMFEETMRGYVGGMPCTAFLKMKMNSQEQKGFSEWKSCISSCNPLLIGKVGGYVEFSAIEKDKLHVIDGKVSLCEVDYRTPYTQYMHYHLLLAASSGSRYILDGKKIINPYLFASYAWRETTTLHVKFKKVAVNNSREDKVHLKGELHISLVELIKSLISLGGNNKGRFICLLLSTLFRTCFLQIPKGSHKDFTPSDLYLKFYPSSTLHEIKTEDGFIISCRQWKCTHDSSKLDGPKQQYPVLLLNGYFTESYWLPTEPNDLVRTLLEEGREVWLLQPRLHPLNPSNNFTIEDIGRFDVPAAINRILELHGQNIKIHVVAHCAGGLAIHVALMGGHVSATHIASLSCTNSSMFFKLNPLSLFKMWLPLIPLSMVILGKNTILSSSETKTSLRHRLLKSIARSIPRYERCTYNECEVFSGIFGNAFWHENLSPGMHYWLNKESATMLPMAGFPHLRKICNAGYIVDSKGNNSYLSHPERMRIPTLYISGGRSLLVTPKTSFLANKYMKLHQPGFRHERVVVDGFGHSDLLIGEESYKKVFPHILSHIRSAEGENGVISGGGKKYSKEALDWEDDPNEESGGFGIWFSPFIVILLFVLFLMLLVALC